MAEPTGITGVFKTDNGKTLIVFRHGSRPGKRYQWVLELAPTPAGIARAAQILEQRRERVRAGLPPIQPDAEDPLVGDAATQWAKEMIAQLDQPDPALSRRTVNDYISAMERIWLPTTGHLKIRMLRFSHLRAIDNDRDWGNNKTRTNARLAVRRFLGWALQGDLIDHNPALKFEKLRIRRRKVLAYDLDQAQTLVQWMIDNESADAALYFGLGFDTGIRPGELIALTWEMFDGDGFTVSKGMSRGELGDNKNHTERYVPVSEGMVTWLVKHRATHMAKGEPNGHVVRNQYGRPYQRPSKLNARFHRACKKTGLPDYLEKHNPYPYRKTFVTGLYESGMDPRDASQIADHSQRVAEQHYVAQSKKQRLIKARRKL